MTGGSRTPKFKFKIFIALYFEILIRMNVGIFLLSFFRDDTVNSFSLIPFHNYLLELCV